MNGYKWIYKDNLQDEQLFSEIKKAAGSDIITKLLINRGITSFKEAEAFLNPGMVELSSPFVFPDMQKALDRIHKAISSQESIVIYGDFDSDGVTSTSLMYKTLTVLNANVDYYIPERTTEGHGLSRAAVCKLISTKKTKLIITVDCGISNLPEVKLAQSLGTDVIITDHHESLEKIPEAYAIINPKLLDIKDIKYLAGVGVAFKLAEALLEANGKQYFINKILPMVAIGTVGDVVPLVGENRILVHKGLNVINSENDPSINKLIELAGHKHDRKITSTTLAFTIVPRINAIGRLSEAITAVEFLTTEDTGRIDELAVELDKNNKERQHLCEHNLKQVEERILNKEVDLSRDKAIILGDRAWHPGIVGLVASRLVEKYYRPALLVSLDERKKEARCSARSIEGLNIFEVLSNFSEYFKQFGGHALAAGFCADLEKIEFEKLKNLILSKINQSLDSELLSPQLKIDFDVNIEDVTQEFIDELDKLAPYGELNPYPVFSNTNLTFVNYKIMGAKKNHLKVNFSNENQNVEGVWWQRNSLDVCPMEKVNIAFVPSVNSFNGKNRIQLILKDMQSVLMHDSEDYFFSKDNIDTQWLDHRNENGFKKDFLDHLKSWGDNLSVFAESKRALEILENVPFLKPFIINRSNVKKTECIVFLDFPPDDMTFIRIMNEINPAEVHFFGLVNDYDPIELIKTISGMFKYAYNDRNGIIDMEKAATALAISNDMLFSCAQLLDNAGVIKILKTKENSLEIRFIGSVNLNSVQELPEYHSFMNSLNEFIELKNDYKTKEIDLIRETLDNLEALLN